MNLWNNLGFSLYAAPSNYYVIANLDERKKSEMGVSTDWCVAVKVKHWRLSSIRVIFVDYQTSKLQCNY